MKHIEFISLLLSNACGSMTPEEVKANGGFQKYYISAHCAQFIVEAKMTEDKSHKKYFLNTDGSIGSKRVELYDWNIRSCVKVV